MRKFLMSAVLAFSLTGCATVGSITPPPEDATVAQQIVWGAQTACGFAPALPSVNALLAALEVTIPYATLVTTGIGIICEGINSIPKSASRLQTNAVVIRVVRLPNGRTLAVPGKCVDARCLQ